MEEKDLNELNEEMCARRVKRSSEIKIAQVSTGKKKRAKKPTAEATEPNIAQNLFELLFERTEGYEMRSRLGDAARYVAEGKITLEEVTRAILDAIRDRNLRLADQGAFYNPPEEPATIELDMEKFNRSAMAIARGRERIATLMRNARPLAPVVEHQSWHIKYQCGGLRSFFPNRGATVARLHTPHFRYDSGLCHRATGQCIRRWGSTSIAPVIYFTFQRRTAGPYAASSCS
jgi:hypothetical protein